ncbi:hypothetical protein [Kitasatospora purpeofusca]|uniref:hypothetical protein n=1 Tax=Kitasatospora purpeofusca TaxID=67352 RepID=UPI0022598A2D|nr:hypothetical protein [Kitasatospora purpeofusca]WSR33734.1 hypothetical protein OG715_23825 [Kitasatospora purpeofusca]
MRQVVAQVDERGAHPADEHKPMPGTRTGCPLPRSTTGNVTPALDHGLPRSGQFGDQIREVPPRDAGQHPMAEDRTIHLDLHSVRSLRPQRRWSHRRRNHAPGR